MFNKNFKKFNGKKDNKGILIAILKHKISNKIIIITYGFGILIFCR